jgi:2-polyprenyl-3-methyl-5-hydroxy-6-metoxy-1,4-benzoquinol methylase
MLQKRLINKYDYIYQGVLFFLNKISIKDKKILDIGCGVGTIDFYLAREGAEVLGIDVSKNGVQIAKANAEKLGIKNNLKFRAVKFPDVVPSGHFDIILCLEVLEHLKRDQKSVSEMKKLLNKDGIIIASSPSINSFLYKKGLLDIFDQEVGHIRRYTEKSFKLLFSRADLDILTFRKAQGVLRDFLFSNPVGGILLKVVNKFPFSFLATVIDNFLIPLFGESDLFILAQKK